MNGERLIRREYQQLVRTTGDMFRLVPFIVIMVVPFLELALPIILKFFPRMLPSTFEDKSKAEDRLQKQLKIKLETAKFLQDTAEDISAAQSMVEFRQVFASFRDQGTVPSLYTKDVIDICKKLGSELNLEGLGRPHLISMCRYLGLRPFGTDRICRLRIYRALKKLHEDDQLILEEGGASSLTENELVSACHARGFRTSGVDAVKLRISLDEWIKLHVVEDIPSSILVLAGAFAHSESIPVSEALKPTVASLPDDIYSEIKSSDLSDPIARLEILKREELLIENELSESNQSSRPAADDLPGSNIAEVSNVVDKLTDDGTVQSKHEEIRALRNKQFQVYTTFGLTLHRLL